MNIQEIENKLSAARAELASAQDRHRAAVERAKQLNEQRKPLVRAKFQGDQKAEAALKKLSSEQFNMQQAADDLRVIIDDCEQEIIKLEHAHDAAVREGKIVAVRNGMAKRFEIAKKIQRTVDDLVKEISEYVEAADQLGYTAQDLALPGVTTNHVKGTPLLRDFIRHRLKFLLTDLGGWTEPQARVSLVEMEQQALKTLNDNINASEGADDSEAA